MTLKAAIFDWDGTITDSNGIKTEAFVELFPKRLSASGRLHPRISAKPRRHLPF